MKVKCNGQRGCQNEFEVKDFELTTMRLAKEDCQVKYFACPHCDEKYIIMVEDAETRKLIRQIDAINKKLSRKLTKQKDIEKHNNLVKQKDKLKLELANCQRELYKLVYPRL